MVGTGGWACGQLIWSYYQVIVGTELPSPSLADLGCAFGQGFLYARPQFLTDLDLAGRFVGG